jgi:hypothetical protein
MERGVTGGIEMRESEYLFRGNIGRNGLTNIPG